MYMLKASHGCIDEPDTARVEVMGTYESRDEAAKAAAIAFAAILHRIDDPETYYGEVRRSRYDYRVTYGYYIDDHYYRVRVIER